MQLRFTQENFQKPGILPDKLACLQIMRFREADLLQAAFFQTSLFVFVYGF